MLYLIIAISGGFAAVLSDFHITAHFLHARFEDKTPAILLRRLVHPRSSHEGTVEGRRVPDRAIIRSCNAQGRRLLCVVMDRERARYIAK